MKIEIEIADEDVRGVGERFKANLPSWARNTGGWHGAVSDMLAGSVWVERPGGIYTNLDIERGLRMMYALHTPFSPNGGLAPNGWGPVECDAFVQYAAFGEIRYV